MRPNRAEAAVAGAASLPLPLDTLANIHSRLSLLDRLAFATAFRCLRHAFRPEAPWLVLPGDALETATLFSLADCRSAVVHALGPDHAVLGSIPRGWLVTADDGARLRLVHPVTGQRRALPAIETISCLFAHDGGSSFSLDLKQFIRGPPPYPDGGVSMTPDAMRRRFYRKVALSNSADVAMMITDPRYGAAAFPTAECRRWRLAPSRHGAAKVGTESVNWPTGPSRDGIEDAVHQAGRFYSITYSGEVETWEQDGDVPGVFTSTVVGRPLLQLPSQEHRKYLVAALGGRLMVVLKETTRRWILKVHVLDAGRESWKEIDDIGDAALFIGVNSSLCVSTRIPPELRAGCVYYTEDDGQGGISIRTFSLKDGMAEEDEGLGPHESWLPPAWFTPSIPLGWWFSKNASQLREQYSLQFLPQETV